MNKLICLFSIIAALSVVRFASAQDRAEAFDLQAHRGGMGLMSEGTLAAFANALELGVSNPGTGHPSHP